MLRLYEHTQPYWPTVYVLTCGVNVNAWDYSENLNAFDLNFLL